MFTNAQIEMETYGLGNYFWFRSLTRLRWSSAENRDRQMINIFQLVQNQRFLYAITFSYRF